MEFVVSLLHIVSETHISKKDQLVFNSYKVQVHHGDPAYAYDYMCQYLRLKVSRGSIIWPILLSEIFGDDYLVVKFYLVGGRK